MSPGPSGDALALAKSKLRDTLSSRPPQPKPSPAALTDRILGAAWWHDATSVAAFVGVKHEPDTTGVLEAALASGKRLVLPRVDGAQLRWGAISRIDELVPGRFGLLEPPSASCTADLHDVGLVLVPGLAFGPRGERLGWGRGYYDRALGTSRPPTALLVGVCWADRFQPAEGPVPVGSRDVAMDRVVTERGDVQCRGEIAHPPEQ